MQELFDNIKKIFLQPKLYLVSTPIGNIKDITIRAIEILKSCDYIFCEDTRISGNLLKLYGIEHKTLYVYNDHSSDEQREKIIYFLKQNKSVVLITDAGTPLISDPGYKIVNKCNENGIDVVPIPGCSSSITALSASGISTDKFLFYGFLSQKKPEKEKELNNLMKRDECCICFDTSVRLMTTLELIKSIDKDRTICVARELTKIYEDIKTDSVSNIINYYKDNQDKLKGEIVIIIEKYINLKKLDLNNMDFIIKESLKYLSVKDSSDFLSKIFQINKKQIYDKLLTFKE